MGRNSLAVQWLGLGAFTAMARVQSLVRELTSRKPRSTAKKKKKNSKNSAITKPTTQLKIGKGWGLPWWSSR